MALASIDEGLVTLLKSQGTITSQLASVGSVFVDAVTQDKDMPYLSISVDSQDPLVVMEGTSGLRQTSIDIDCVAQARTRANDLADAVDEFIADYTGAAGTATIDAVVLDNVFHQAVSLGQASDQYKFVTTLSIDVFHK